MSSRLLFLSGGQHPCLFSQPDVMWVSLPSSSALSWGAWLRVETPYFSGGTFAAELFLQNLSCHL